MTSKTSIKTDLCIIGGGINGTGIAADAAGRGLNVVLCESHDLASGTSSASTKLIHGGLRYLEQYEFKLVRKALHEREVLMQKAPHLIYPLEFVLPHDKHLRPVWMLRAGLLLYDNLARRRFLPKSRKINFKNSPEGTPLKDKFTVGFGYADCGVDDARLVVLNAKEAHNHGANILTRTACVKAVRENQHWRVTLKNQITGEESDIIAKVLINAAGPWIGEVFNDVIHTDSKQQVKLVKGSHIVVRKLYEGEHAYILQNADNRIVFAIPYQDEFTLIGTTDLSYTSDLRQVAITTNEKQYLCDLINTYFKKTVTLDDIVWDYSGIRPLYDDKHADPSKITRDYRLELDHKNNQAPVLSIFGGKVTTYRKLAEHVLETLKPYFPDLSPAWTAHKPLPGGNIKGTLSSYLETIKKRYPWLPEKLAERFVKAYGTLLEVILENTTQLSDLGHHFGAGLYQKEVEYLINQEWARSADDILWRRTKLGLHIDLKSATLLEEWIQEYKKQ